MHDRELRLSSGLPRFDRAEGEKTEGDGALDLEDVVIFEHPRVPRELARVIDLVAVAPIEQ